MALILANKGHKPISSRALARQCDYKTWERQKCTEEVISEGNLCIFHDPDLNKDVEQLRTRLKERLSDQTEDPIRLDGTIFPDGHSFKDASFGQSISFRNAQFHGKRTSFSGAQFRGRETSFVGAQFYGEETSFATAQFHGERISFVGAQFHGKETSFATAQFHGKRISFLRAQFHGKETSFVGAQFHGEETSFAGAQFRGDRISFLGAQFHDERTSFVGAEFRGDRISFLGAQFHGKEISFGSAQFHGRETSFLQAQFYAETTSFAGAQFYGKETVFLQAQFNGKDTSFLDAQFDGESTSFAGAQFHSDETSFYGAQFHGRMLFKGNRPKQVFLNGRSDFRSINVGEKGELVFDWVDLSRTLFLQSTLAGVKFLDVAWDHRPEWTIGPFQWRRWRSRVYDEGDWREDRHDEKNREATDTKYLAHLSRLYRALKAYYRESREYELVGHFHYGLMDVQWHQREERRKWKKWLSWQALYRYSSGYGEDYALAGLVLLGLLVAFGGCYWWAGVPSDPGLQTEPWWKQGLHALLYSFQAGTFGLVSFYDTPTRLVGRYLQLVESILVPVQFGFFLFALRNYFRR